MYVVAFLVIFGVNVLPAFGPPTWSVLVLFRLHSHLNAVALITLGAIAAASGRYLLARGARLLASRLSAKRTANLEAARAKLTGGRGRSLAGLGLFALSPVPSAQLFEAVGLMRIRLVPVVGVFFAGRLVSYSVYVAGATALRHSTFSRLITSSLTSPLGITVQLVMLGGISPWPASIGSPSSAGTTVQTKTAKEISLNVGRPFGWRSRGLMR